MSIIHLNLFRNVKQGKQDNTTFKTGDNFTIISLSRCLPKREAISPPNRVHIYLLVIRATCPAHLLLLSSYHSNTIIRTLILQPHIRQFSQSLLHLLYYVCIVVFTLDAGLLARNQYSVGPATDHLDTCLSWFPCVYKQMLRWFPRYQVATKCISCSPPDLNLLATNFIFCIHVEQPLPPSDKPFAVNK